MLPDIPNVCKIYSLKGQELPVMQISSHTVPAGFHSPAADYMEDEIDFNHLIRPRPSSTFVVRVQGDSMIEANIPNNALLIVDRSIKPASGNIVVAIIDSEFTVKRFIKN